MQIEFNGVLTIQDLGCGRKEVSVFDADTGALILKKYVGSVRRVLEEGYNVVESELTVERKPIIAELMVGREQVSNTVDFIVISDYGGGIPDVLFSFFHNRNKHPRKGSKPKGTGNKRQYMKVYQTKLMSLKVSSGAVLLLLQACSLIDWNTGIIGSPESPLGVNAIARKLKTHPASCSRYLRELIEAGAVRKEGNAFVVSKEYVEKG